MDSNSRQVCMRFCCVFTSFQISAFIFLAINTVIAQSICLWMNEIWNLHCLQVHMHVLHSFIHSDKSMRIEIWRTVWISNISRYLMKHTIAFESLREKSLINEIFTVSSNVFGRFTLIGREYEWNSLRYIYLIQSSLTHSICMLILWDERYTKHTQTLSPKAYTQFTLLIQTILLPFFHLRTQSFIDWW